MKVRVLARHVPNVGRQGEERTIDGPSARLLILLGKVEQVIPPKPKPQVEKQTRTYKRRDVVAERPLTLPAIDPEIFTLPAEDYE